MPKKICKECTHHVRHKGKWFCGKNATYEPDEVTGENEWTGLVLCKDARKDEAQCGPDAAWYLTYIHDDPAPAQWPMECGSCPVKQRFDQENQTEET